MNLLTPLQTTPGSGATIIFFPHAGGSPRFYRHLSAALPDHDVAAITYPGRDHLISEEPLTDMSELSSRAAAELANLANMNEQPLVLAGHSLGAYVAYETAAALPQSMASTSTVIVSGQSPPLPHRNRSAAEAETDDEIIADVLRQNPASAPVWNSAELREFFLPMLRADYRLLANYRPSGSVVCRIDVVVGDGDDEVDRTRLPDWQQFSEALIGIHLVRGGHFYLERPDTQLAQIVKRLPVPNLCGTEAHRND